MAFFNGQLNTNEILGFWYNMVISQHVEDFNAASLYGRLLDKNRVDGSLYGDTKLYFFTDALHTDEWTQDSESSCNVLAVHRPPEPAAQAVTINRFRQIALTLDSYMSKRAWSTEGAFRRFQDVMNGWLSATKRIHEETTFNTYVGTTDGIKVTVDALPEAGTEANNRLRAQKISEAAANILTEMGDYSRSFNELHILAAYSPAELAIVWPSSIVNEITKLDVPTVFGREQLLDGIKFAEYVIPARYFGEPTGSAQTCAAYAAGDTTLRAVEESKLEFSDKTIAYVFAGDVIPKKNGAATLSKINGRTSIAAGEAYTEASKEAGTLPLFKVVYANEAVPLMSGFSVATSFYNARNLSENQYLTFGYNKPEHLAGRPFVTVYAE